MTEGEQNCPNNLSVIEPLKKISLFFLNLFIFCLFRATPVAYGSSQARGHIGATAAGLHHSPQQGSIRAVSATYTTAHGNTGPLTH